MGLESDTKETYISILQETPGSKSRWDNTYR
jgi:hypothetical protein